VSEEFVSDELAFEKARELADELETELLQRPATLEELKLLKLAYTTQARLEDRQRADRTRLERDTRRPVHCHGSSGLSRSCHGRSALRPTAVATHPNVRSGPKSGRTEARR
jgi:hypothetical protein